MKAHLFIIKCAGYIFWQLMLRRILYLLTGILYLLTGILYLLTGILYLLTGILYLLTGILYLLTGILYLLTGILYLLTGILEKWLGTVQSLAVSDSNFKDEESLTSVKAAEGTSYTPFSDVKIVRLAIALDSSSVK